MSSSVPLEDRFWEKVDKGEPDECWEWTATTSRGYGYIWAYGKVRPANRVVYWMEVEDPGDEYVLHTCDNPPCVNPNHLYLGSHSDNMQDGFDRGQKDHHGENNPFSVLTGDNVRDIKSRIGGDETYSEIGEDYGVGKATISHIANGRTWSHINE